jgi:hypothetical protein
VRLGRIVGIVYLVIGGLVLIGASQMPTDHHTRAIGYIAGLAFIALAVWRFFAPKGH